jgi:hypothetical protein
VRVYTTIQQLNTYLITQLQHLYSFIYYYTSVSLKRVNNASIRLHKPLEDVHVDGNILLLLLLSLLLLAPGPFC